MESQRGQQRSDRARGWDRRVEAEEFASRAEWEESAWDHPDEVAITDDESKKFKTIR
ncbi:hypothetical protein VMT65_17665 [Nocardia sp. CDC153]|uniref:hypothetical protein n=1 Tax=Nocardia sp. CDC153 TaxID=3112167 RepID=UPI002DBF2FDA|nr:hypothetical protein [Nocardia sp. CDC153]MEC3954872.1 hypothetical protein [Nocardia sp. CDC153]